MNEHCRETINSVGAREVPGGMEMLVSPLHNHRPGPREYSRGVPLRPPLGVALLFALVLFLFPLSASAHTNTATGRIYGQLLDGTKRNAPVVGQSITLQMAQGEN